MNSLRYSVPRLQTQPALESDIRKADLYRFLSREGGIRLPGVEGFKRCEVFRTGSYAVFGRIEEISRGSAAYAVRHGVWPVGKMRERPAAEIRGEGFACGDQGGDRPFGGLKLLARPEGEDVVHPLLSCAWNRREKGESEAGQTSAPTRPQGGAR